MVVEAPLRKTAAKFLFDFRLITIMYAGFLGLTGLRKVSLVSIIVALLYNIPIYCFKDHVSNHLKKYPFLILLDFAVIWFLFGNSGVYKTPFYLYLFSTLVLGGFLFGYWGALFVSTLMSVEYTMRIYASGMDPSYLTKFGEHIASYYFYFFFVAFSLAYLSHLLDKLDKVNLTKINKQCQLDKTRECLTLALPFSDLSKREQHVILMLINGTKIEQIAKELEISKNTVKTHLRRIYEKLDVGSREEAIALLLKASESYE